jgi:hypothetical protein
MEKVQERLGPFVVKRENLHLEFNDVIDYSLTIKKFEQRCVHMMERCGVDDNTHLLYLYDLREFFQPILDIVSSLSCKLQLEAKGLMYFLRNMFTLTTIFYGSSSST